MILTITLNPAIDIAYHIDELKEGEVNRCTKYRKTAGGKGINVTKVLQDLDCPVMATGFLGGTNGEFIKKELHKRKIGVNFVDILDETRNCIAIISRQQTEILEAGPLITEKEGNSFLQHLEGTLRKYDIDVIAASGSIPRGLGSRYYKQLIEIANERGIKFVLDSSGIYLKEAIKATPYLIKPNIAEMEELYGERIGSLEKLIDAMRGLRAHHIEMIVVSLGKDGCVSLCGNKVYKVTVPKIKLKNPVGSGDAMVAGMVKAIHDKYSHQEILKIGSACGALNAMNEETGAIKMKDFQGIYNEVKVEIIKTVDIA